MIRPRDSTSGGDHQDRAALSPLEKQNASSIVPLVEPCTDRRLKLPCR
jgi:hypothetical protein